MIALIVCYFCIFSIYIIKCKDNKKFYNLKVKFYFLSGQSMSILLIC